ncbi:MAG: hypothetical protein JWM47_3381, partial [Acidimicrobiales bacterium]|nr:hypothetical protein [Acidimicrobiales bacterium]
LARAHPAEPGFVPAPSAADPRASVARLADRADRQRPPRRWGRPLAIGAGVAAVLGVVAAAVAIGVSGRTPDGSVTGAELSATVANALTASRYVRVDVDVVEPGAGDRPVMTSHRLMLADDGSWSTGRTDAIDQAAFDAPAGVVQRAAIVGAEDGGAGTVLATVARGLAAGPPDPGVEPVPWLADLQAAGMVLRGDGGRRAPLTGTSDRRTWTYTRTADTGPGGAAESWSVEVRRSDGTPLRIERRRAGALVRRVRFGVWTPVAEVPVETFSAAPPAGAATTDHGFAPADLPAVELLGRGQAVTPSWLPPGFALGAVYLRDRPPAGAASTAGGANPADRAVVSLGYQRGPERITVTTRARGGTGAAWVSPFATAAAGPASGASSRTLGDGRFNQARVHVTTDPLGRATLWGLSGDVVFTVGGDLTVPEAIRLASSLR